MERYQWSFIDDFVEYLRIFHIKKYVKEINNPICVDIGCGQDATFLKSICKNIKFGYGFDIRANDVNFENISIINNEKFGGNIPLDTASVDIVYMLAVIEHLDSYENLVTEAKRILKSNGLFVMTTPTPFAKPILEFLAFKLHIISKDAIAEHKHYYTKDELYNIINSKEMEVFTYKKFEFACNQLIVGKKK